MIVNLNMRISGSKMKIYQGIPLSYLLWLIEGQYGTQRYMFMGGGIKGSIGGKWQLSAQRGIAEGNKETIRGPLGTICGQGQ